MSARLALGRAAHGLPSGVVAVAGASILYGLGTRKPPLRNDSHTAPSRPIVPTQERIGQDDRTPDNSLPSIHSTWDSKTVSESPNNLTESSEDDVPLVGLFGVFSTLLKMFLLLLLKGMSCNMAFSSA